jgi:radical SAM protein with 4Fe4S-binding SPASM domain
MLFPCRDPWETMIVSWDGDVNLCCGSYEKKDRMGNVFEEPVRRIWNNARYQAARRSIRHQARHGDPRVLCRTCPGMLL